MKTVGFIGVGNIASAMIPQLLNNNFCDTKHLFIHDIDKKKATQIGNKYHVQLADSAKDLTTKSDIIILSVKPFVIHNIIHEINDYVTTQLIVSPAAGISIQSLVKIFDNEVHITRIMPNLGASVGKSMTAYYCYNLSEKEETLVQELLSSFGNYLKIEESMFDSYTSLCGSSPAFFAYFIQSMVAYAVTQGYGLEQAREIITYTMLSTADVLLDTPYNEQDLINKVATKGGTTEAGLNIFNELKLSSIVKIGLDAATKKSQLLQIKNNEWSNRQVISSLS